jgi:hypothetical protein
MKTLGVLESKWDLIRQKLVRRLLEELAGQGVTGLLRTEGWSAKLRSQRGEGNQGKCREHVKWDMYA